MLKVSPNRQFVISLLLLILLITPTAAQAQVTSVSLSSLEVDLWPEYDEPDMLVIYKITLASDVSLPTSLTFKIPAAAGSPHAVAELQVDTLVNITYTERLEGDWNLITFTATVPELWIEYYDPALEKTGDTRQYSFVWPGGYAVNSLIVDVQQPWNAQNMRISPSIGTGQTGSDTLTHYIAQVGSLEEGQSFNLEIMYEKPDDVLSAEMIKVQPAEPLTEDTSGRVSSTLNIPNDLIWLGLLGILGLGLIIGGAVWYFRSSQKETAAPPRRRRSP
ncbi:MAG: hypothetical protein EHM41_08915, partial [Chloroflexi bacterium]